MARVLPSEVADRIQWAYGWISGRGPGSVASRMDGMTIAAILALVHQIPESMLRLSATEHSDFIWAIASLNHLVKMLVSGEVSHGGGWPWPTFGNVDGMTTLLAVAQKVPE